MRRRLLYAVEWRRSLLARLGIFPVAELIVDIGGEVGGEASVVCLHSGLGVMNMGVHGDDCLEFLDERIDFLNPSSTAT